MTDHGLYYTDDMIRAFLDGRKTQTRRPIAAHNSTVNGHGVTAKSPAWRTLDWGGDITVDRGGPSNPITHATIDYLWVPTGYRDATRRVSPRIETGDRVYAREAWCEFVPEHRPPRYAYRANTGPDGERARQEYIKLGYPYQWHPSIHMPKAFARLWDKVVDVRAQRVQDISEADAIAEGSFLGRCLCTEMQRKPRTPIERAFKQTGCCVHGTEFSALWDACYAARGLGWAQNPWVWAYTLEEIEHGQD